jgi:NAD(P)-dependent dehydrogenase (short-subunit alcohol dehydrogenase family)
VATVRAPVSPAYCEAHRFQDCQLLSSASISTKALAVEYATRGVRFNAVSPGIIRTSMHPAETHELMASLHPVGRMGDTGDVTDAILYLENAPFVTGEILHVDGGQSAGH